MDLMYEVENESEVIEDITVLANGLRLLEYDYLGGHGSRGYGKIKFHDVCADVVIGNLNPALLSECNRILSDATEEK